MDNYDDIKHLTRPQYDEFPPMSSFDRAAQFSPFAALVGYGDAVDESARLVGSRYELTEDQADELNSSLNRLIDNLDQQPEVRVTHFVPDERKSGGAYVEKVGTVRIFDSYSGELVFTDGDRIALADMAKLDFVE